MNRNHNPTPPSGAGTRTPWTCKLPNKFRPPSPLGRFMLLSDSSSFDPSSRERALLLVKSMSPLDATGVAVPDPAADSEYSELIIRFMIVWGPGPAAPLLSSIAPGAVMDSTCHELERCRPADMSNSPFVSRVAGKLGSLVVDSKTALLPTEGARDRGWRGGTDDGSHNSAAHTRRLGSKELPEFSDLGFTRQRQAHFALTSSSSQPCLVGLTIDARKRRIGG